MVHWRQTPAWLMLAWPVLVLLPAFVARRDVETAEPEVHQLEDAQTPRAGEFKRWAS